MNYKLPTGHTVITRNVDTGKEFETLNEQGETISTVRLPQDEASELLSNLMVIGAKSAA